MYYIRAKIPPYRIPTGTGVVTVPAYREAGPYDHEHEMMNALVEILAENGNNGTVVEVIRKTAKTHVDRSVKDKRDYAKILADFRAAIAK